MPAYRQGRCRWRLQRTNNVSLPAGSNYVAWENVIFDDVGGWDLNTSYVCDRPGLWLVSAIVNRASVASASATVVRVHKNGVNQNQVTGVATTAALQIQVTGLIEAAAGDYFEVNTTLHSSIAATLTAGNTVFMGVRVGPLAWRG